MFSNRRRNLRPHNASVGVTISPSDSTAVASIAGFSGDPYGAMGSLDGSAAPIGVGGIISFPSGDWQMAALIGYGGLM